MTATARLTADPIDAAAELAIVTNAASGCGGVVSFTGIARPLDLQGAIVESLFLDHYPGMTERSLARIAQAALARCNVAALGIVHRHGRILPGETIVFVAAAAPHRRAAFEAVDLAMDLLKTDAMFWKREEGGGGARWIEPSVRDHADRARWCL